MGPRQGGSYEIMAILFFGMMLPIGLLMRAFGKDFLPAWPVTRRRRPTGCRATIRDRNLSSTKP